jgi:hypothetical protein
MVLLLAEVSAGDRNVGAAARRFFAAPDGRTRARALEALDALLPRALALRIIPALEDPALGAPPPSFDDATRAELGGGEPLSRVLLVHAMGKGGRSTHKDAIRAAALAGSVEADPLRLLRRIQDMVAEEDRPDVPSSVETMITLREVPLLAELTPAQLAQLAEIATWHTYAAGEPISGDDGDDAGAALCVVVSGRVKAGDAEVGAGAAFGQRAFLGGDALMPHATAEEKTRLLRVGREEFERVVEDAPGIALAVCRVLARLV